MFILISVFDNMIPRYGPVFKFLIRSGKKFSTVETKFFFSTSQAKFFTTLYGFPRHRNAFYSSRFLSSRQDKPGKKIASPALQNEEENKTQDVNNQESEEIKAPFLEVIKKARDSSGQADKMKTPIIEIIKQAASKESLGKGETPKKPPTATKGLTGKLKKPRVRVDLSASSMERNFITASRAMSDYMLKPGDLEGLKATKRRSPYDTEPAITVYWLKDVEAKAIEVWGSKENFEKERLSRDLERKFHEQNMFARKKRLRVYRREINTLSDIAMSKTAGLHGSSGQVVLIAVGINGSNFLFKLFAWLYTGSHSMFSESIHSLADTINQLILAYGIHKSVQRADPDHPYGYTNMKYVASLISGVGIFCVGAGLSIYHGITGLISPPETIESFYWAFWVLLGSLISEGATLLVAINSIKKGAQEKGMTFAQYVWRGQDPSVNVVLLEDFGAVLGVGVAGFCMALTSITNNHVYDAVGSLAIGGILGAVASVIIYTNVTALVGRSIPESQLEMINRELENDVMIRAIHDVKGIDMGNCLVRYKAELDFDGRQLAKSYLDKQDLNKLLEEVNKFKDLDELEEFILKHSENIIDMMGGEIDRIEMKLRKKFPEIRHCDLEIL